MPATTWIALLRGINVGGGNIIPMAALRACVSRAGMADVASYIQSGNLVFEAPRGDAAGLLRRLESAISTAFPPYQARLVLRTGAQLRRIVEEAPGGFGTEPDRFRYDVVYLRPALTAAKALPQVPARAGVDTVAAGPGVLYFSRLVARVTQSQIARLASLPVYQEMTIRNWNTTTRLLAMVEERKAD